MLEFGPMARSGLRILTGGLICLVLFLTVRRVQHGRGVPGRRMVDRRQVSEVVFRLAAVGLAGIGVFGTAIPDRFPSLPVELVLASAWLMAVGAVIVLASRELLWIGIGLLTIESGFETLYSALDPRMVSAGLLAMSGLLLALLVAVIVTFTDERATP